MCTLIWETFKATSAHVSKTNVKKETDAPSFRIVTRKSNVTSRKVFLVQTSKTENLYNCVLLGEILQRKSYLDIEIILGKAQIWGVYTFVSQELQTKLPGFYKNHTSFPKF